MVKKEFIKAYAEKLGVTHEDAKLALEKFFETVVEGVNADGKVLLKGYGSFELKEMKAREGKNPRTKETIQIEASNSIKFKPSQNLKDEIK